ncbi:MAG: glycoside hydrolase family 2, partial [Clostridia bacterium]|nr:glycoside hydrolase family 2 [Clostridia bacterium]
TAEWVEKCFRRVKELDPTRLVEDNSVCNRDHTVTDVNTWHFYSNGYERVKGVVDGFCNGAYVGSRENYKEGYTMQDVPCMNSECGNVWGIRGNAGESDISWQYKYMMNEFRLHDKLCGFVFTEFHDVVNEFNGYYKIDNSDKDFGYDVYGMSIRDLHSQDYLGADFAPMTTVKAGETVTLPMFGSSFTDVRHGKVLDIVWQLTASDPVNGAEAEVCDFGEYSIVWEGYGTFNAGAIRAAMPDFDGTAILSWQLLDGDEVIMTNAVMFDVQASRDDVLAIAPASLNGEGFARAFTAQEGNKLNGLVSGTFSVTVKTADIPNFADADNLHILFEASTRAPMTHDFPKEEANVKIDLNYMLGYRCDPGENRNSVPQTDEVPNPGDVTVAIDGVPCATVLLPDCPADSRGALSHHYQIVDDLLDEAGTYGYLCDVRVPSALLLGMKYKDEITLTFSTESGNGLSIFGRMSGRYGFDIVMKAE